MVNHIKEHPRDVHEESKVKHLKADSVKWKNVELTQVNKKELYT